jgi:hypothetical protein
MSKPDINSSQELVSEASSPSPGLGGQLQHSTEPPRGYAASVPVTPTYDFSGSFEDSFRNHNKVSGSGGQLTMSRSTNVSRKSSLAQMHTAVPLASKIEQGYLNPRDGLRSQWDLTSHGENTAPISGGFHGLGDTAEPFWRLDSSSSSFVSLDPTAFGGIESELQELQDDTACYSQASSRVGSIDQGAIPMYALGTYPSERDFVGVSPGLVSASASTASLTASLSEASQYGDGATSVSPFYMANWGDRNLELEPGSYESGSPLNKQPSFESAASWIEESPYHMPFSAPVEMSM